MIRDTLGRPLEELRISVTDRCNFRCSYCMPQDRYEWIDRREILRFEEIARMARLFVRLGVQKIRITGGEPLLRRSLDKLVALITPLGLKDICLTTNGSLLKEAAPALAAAGVKRVNVSVDTLDPGKFRRLTRGNDLSEILEGLCAAQRSGLNPVKINSVIERGVNDGEIVDLLEFSREHGFALRFIEYMDVGNANSWNMGKTVTKREMLEIINARMPLEEIGKEARSASSVIYRFADGRGGVGVIASVSEPFCADCTRARLTSDGRLVTCLFSEQGYDLKRLIRGGASDDEVCAAIGSVWNSRRDRYSEERLAAMKSAAGYQARARKKIEMISLGG